MSNEKEDAEQEISRKSYVCMIYIDQLVKVLRLIGKSVTVLVRILLLVRTGLRNEKCDSIKGQQIWDASVGENYFLAMQICKVRKIY